MYFIDYNKNVRSVDSADKYLAFCSIFEKTRKWSKKTALFILNCALYNSFRVFLEATQSESIRYADFLLRIAETWLISHRGEDGNYSPSTSTRAPRQDPPGRLSGNLKEHQIERIKTERTNKFTRKRCRVCYANKKRSETKYMCSFCKVPHNLKIVSMPIILNKIIDFSILNL